MERRASWCCVQFVFPNSVRKWVRGNPEHSQPPRPRQLHFLQKTRRRVHPAAPGSPVTEQIQTDALSAPPAASARVPRGTRGPGRRGPAPPRADPGPRLISHRPRNRAVVTAALVSPRPAFRRLTGDCTAPCARLWSRARGPRAPLALDKWAPRVPLGHISPRVSFQVPLYGDDLSLTGERALGPTAPPSTGQELARRLHLLIRPKSTPTGHLPAHRSGPSLHTGEPSPLSKYPRPPRETPSQNPSPFTGLRGAPPEAQTRSPLAVGRELHGPAGRAGQRPP